MRPPSPSRPPPATAAQATEEPPPAPAAAAAADAPEADECVICLEPWSSEGPHRVAALRRCGHLFGASCVRAAVASQALGRCPLCNEPASAGDVINLFVSGGASSSARISATDGAAAAAAERVAEAEQAARKAAEKALASARAEVKRLKGEMRKMARANARLVALLGPSSVDAAAAAAAAIANDLTGRAGAAAAPVDESGRPLPTSLPPPPAAAAKRARTGGGEGERSGGMRGETASAAPSPALPFFRASVTILPAAFEARCAAAAAAAGIAVVGGESSRRAQLQIVSLLAPRVPSSSVLLAEGASVCGVALGPGGKTALAAVRCGGGGGPRGGGPSLTLVSLEASAVALRVPTTRQVRSVAWLAEHLVAAGLEGERVAVFDLRMASSSFCSGSSGVGVRGGGGGGGGERALDVFPSVQGAAARGLLSELRRQCAPGRSATSVHTLLPLGVGGVGEGGAGRALLAASAAGVAVWGDCTSPTSSLPPRFAPAPPGLSCVGAAAVSAAADPNYRASPSSSFDEEQQQQRQRQPLVVASYYDPAGSCDLAPSMAAREPPLEHHLLRLVMQQQQQQQQQQRQQQRQQLPTPLRPGGGSAGPAPLLSPFASAATFAGGGCRSSSLLLQGTGSALLWGRGGAGAGGEGEGPLWFAAGDGASVALWDAGRAAAEAAEAEEGGARRRNRGYPRDANAAAVAPPARPLAVTQPHPSPVRCVAAMGPAEGGSGGGGGGASGGAFVSLCSRQFQVWRWRR
jgi:hypothetical protein